MAWQWSKVDEKGLARFVTPEVVNLVQLPVNRLDLSSAPDGRRQLIEAIYNTVAKQGVRYALEQYHPSAAVQLIRTPAEILQVPREGTCLDLAVLFCGLCLGYELLPLLIVIEGPRLGGRLTHPRTP
jgi:hypothetical protein